MSGFACVNLPRSRHLKHTSDNQDSSEPSPSLDIPSGYASPASSKHFLPTQAPPSAPKEPKAMRRPSPKVILPTNAQHSKSSILPGQGLAFNALCSNVTAAASDSADSRTHELPSEDRVDSRTPTHTNGKRNMVTHEIRRQQPIREVRLVSSIEQSITKAIRHGDISIFDAATDISSPGFRTPTSSGQSYRSKSATHSTPEKRRRDGIWTPSSNSSSRLSFGESPNLSSDLSPRPCTSGGRDGRQVLKIESRDSRFSSRRDSNIITRTSPSPLLSDQDEPAQRFENDGFVEQNSFDFARARLEFAKKEYSELKNRYLQEQRKRKEMSVDNQDDRQISCMCGSVKKRKYAANMLAAPRGLKMETETTLDSDPPDKKLGTEASVHIKTTPCKDAAVGAPSYEKSKAIAFEGLKKALDDVSQMQTRAINNDKPYTEIQASKATVDDNHKNTVNPSYECRMQPRANSRDHTQASSLRQCASSSDIARPRKKKALRPEEHPRDRREISMPVTVHECTCRSLPENFKGPQLLEPSLTSWGAGKAELLAHVGQISECRGHPERVINYCRLILEREGRAEQVRQVAHKNC